MKVLVTGATGFLGSHVAEQLKEQGHHVRALIRKSSDTSFLKQLGVELHVASLETGEGLAEAVADVDAVVHSAGLVKARSPEEFRQVNVQGTQNLIDAARKVQEHIRRFVYVSSLAASGPCVNGQPRVASDDPQPVTHYGRSKLEGERAVLAAQDIFPVTVIRPPAIYGPRDREMYAFFKTVQRRVYPLMGRGNTASLIHGRDAAAAIVQALLVEHPTGRVYFVDDGSVYTWEEMGATLQSELGVRALPLRLPLRLFSLVALGTEFYGKLRNRSVMLTRDKLNELCQPHWVCQSSDITEELGWKPAYDFTSGARDTIAWYRSQGWL